MPTLESLQNIRLAWIRTLSGENADYRNLQRVELDAFAWAEDENLLQLQKGVSERIFSPNRTTKIYLPKPSGLLRPISILRIRDTIIYQAIANVMAVKARRQHSPYYFKTVFSNVLTMQSGYPYFYRNWKYGYRKLDSAKKQALNQGYVWVGELDLASFYDVVDHRLLRQTLGEFYDDTDVLDLLFLCLQTWTIHPGGYTHGHGIPQGPLPSSFLSECCLHSLDKKMTKLGNTVYLRYVDDITIMSTSEQDAKRNFARVEIACRELALVPQVKRSIQKVNNLEDLIIEEPSPIQSGSDFPPSIQKGQNDAVRKIFLGCFRGNKLRSKERQLVSKLRYSLFRMNPDKRILIKVLNLLIMMPCVGDAVNYYLRKYGDNTDICGFLFNYLESKPIYAFVSANCLETLYPSCVKGSYNRLRKLCISFLSEKHQIILRCTAAKILGLRRIHETALHKLVTKSNDAYFIEYLLFALNNTLTNTDKEVLFNEFARAEDADIALTSAYLLTSENLKLLGNTATLNTWATPVLTRYGLTRKRTIGDRIGEILKKRYEVNLPPNLGFRKVFNRGQYKQALTHLSQAEGGFTTQRAFWVTQMDNFNQILLFVTLNKLGVRVNMDGVFGSLSSNLLRNKFPSLAAVCDRCHVLRSSSFVAHAYSSRNKTFTGDLKVRQRNALYEELKIAYQEFIDKF